MSVLGSRRSSRPLLAIVAAIATLFALLAAVAPAQAAVPVAPSGLGPDGTSISALPVLSWDRVPDATTYDVQVSTTSSFSSTLWSLSATWNDKATPIAQLPLGTLYWRVRSHNNDGTSDWTQASFDHEAVTPPTPTAPADNATLQPPDDTPVFQWSAVDGATGYVVRIGQDSDFTDPSRYTVLTAVQARAAVLNGVLQPNTYYWEVQAKLGTGYTTDWSAPRSLTILGLAQPDLQGPPDDINGAVQDVVLDWTSVPGAVGYDLQVSTDSSFNTTVANVSNVKGTRYSPPTTLNNDQYYWRVRPVDAGGFTNSWTAAPIWHFKRNWPDQPELRYPADGATVGDPFYLQWSPVPHASRYEVQVSTDPNFTSTSSPKNPITCETRHTTLTPVATNDGTTRACMPGAYGTYYWRVYAIDDPRTDVVQTDYIAAQVHTFTYAPDLVQQTSPADGTSVSVPTLSWAPVAGAAQYQVSYTDTATSDTKTVTTDTTAYTPRVQLTTGDIYRWSVRAVTVDGRLGGVLLPASQPRFTVLDPPAGAGPSPVPTSGNTSTKRFPTLTWQQVTGARSYVVYVRRTGAVAWTALNNSVQFSYPAAEDTGDAFSTSGGNGTSQQYDWYVDAYDEDGDVMATGPIGNYTIEPPAAITGFTAALTGDDLTGADGETPDSCAATLPAECQNLRQTPVLKWDPNDDTGFYRIYLTYDGANNGVAGLFPVPVSGTMWIDPKALPDSQAGSAYYWTVVPCTSPNSCLPLDHAAHAFNKQSDPVVLTSPVSADPGNPTQVANDVTFTWQDYLASEATADTSDTSLESPAETEAQQYRIQVSTTPDFSSVLDTAVVDQTTYTAYTSTYPEGPLYWRVQAVDASGNNLNWSATGTFVKASPAPALTYPVSGGGGVPTVNGTNAFTWDAQRFAKSYDIEVYKNDDLVGQTANRVISANSLVTAYAPSSWLPVSGTPYTWRVRRVDADNRKGAWSPFQEFVVTGDSPTLTAPVNGSAQAPNDTLYSWLPTTGAAKYLFERRLAGSSTVAESVTTAATSYAETKLLTTGTWQWRVTAQDANGNALGAPGSWTDMQFTVDAGITPDNDVSVAGSSDVGSLQTLTAPTWDLPGVTTTYQWQRNGASISGQTGTSYTLVQADVGKQVTVKATGTKPGYTNGTSISDPVTVTAGPAPIANVDPSISGTPRYGQILTADHGVWPGTPTYRYQWLRNGTAIPGSTSTSYRVQAVDAGKKISVRVTATITGYNPGEATSATVTVKKLLSTTTAVLHATTIRKKAHGKIALTVTGSGVLKPTGKLQVMQGKKVLVTITLKAKNNGLKTITLPKLGKGRHRLRVVYTGSSSVNASKSKIAILKVTS